MPVQIAKPRRTIVFNDASYGNDDINRLDILIVLQMSKKCVQKIVLILVGGELHALDDMVARVKKGDKSFGAANVNREIHTYIITQGWQEKKMDWLADKLVLQGGQNEGNLIKQKDIWARSRAFEVIQAQPGTLESC